MIKVQITLVASPRNHLYRTGQSLVEVCLFRTGLKTKLHHLRYFADDFDFEPILGRSYRNVLDQSSEDLHGLIPYLRVLERMLELFNFLPVNRRQIRVEAHRIGWRCCQTLFDISPGSLEFVQSPLKARGAQAISYGLDEPPEL